MKPVPPYNSTGDWPRLVSNATATLAKRVSDLEARAAADVTFAPAGNISATNVQDALTELDGEKAGLAGATFTGQVVNVKANDTATGGGQVYLNGVDGNRLDFNTSGTGAPAFTTRTAGTKIVLYPNVSPSAVDFAIGMEADHIWMSVANSGDGFKWYAGTTNIASLSGAGLLTVNSLRINATPTAAAVAQTHYVPVSINGVTYKLLLAS